MNGKNLLAGVVTVLSGLMVTAVSADVVLSGRLIGSVENIRGGGSNTDANGNTIFVPRTRFNDESSYVRISGIEKLGNSGVEAGFQIESGFDLSGGSASGDNFNTVNSGNSTRGIATRNSGVFMQGGFGKILFGRWDVFYDTIYQIEPDRKSLANKVSLLSLFNTPTGGTVLFIPVLQNGLPDPNNRYYFGFDSNLGDRYNNVLSYSSPILAGLQVQLAYVPTNESSTLGKRYDGQIYMGTLMYDGSSHNFPLVLLASGFQQKADFTTTGQSPTVQVINSPLVGVLPGTILFKDYKLTVGRFGAAVKLPLAEEMTLHIGAVYQPSTLSMVPFPNFNSDSTTYKRQSFGFPLALMLGSNTFYLTYGHNGKVKFDGSDLDNSDANFYMAGYNYDISKRTAIGAYFAQLQNKPGAAYDFYVNGLNNATSGSYGGSLNSAVTSVDAAGAPNGSYSYRNGVKARAIGISFRHLF